MIIAPITIENVDSLIPAINTETCSDAEFDAHCKLENDLHDEAMRNLDIEMGINPKAEQHSKRRP